MDPYEDFDFSSRLTAIQALERLKRYTASQGKGSFYGQVQGNHFNLNHDTGWASVAPELSGYVIAEGEGSRIFVRTHVVGTLDKYGYLILTGGGSLIYAMMQSPGIGVFIFKIIDKNRLAFWAFLGIILIGAVIVVRRTMKKFRREGRFQVISRFMDYMDADLTSTIHNPALLNRLNKELLKREA